MMTKQQSAALAAPPRVSAASSDESRLLCAFASCSFISGSTTQPDAALTAAAAKRT